MPSATAPSQLSQRGHPKTRCGAKSRQHGRPCKLTAGFGTDHLGFGHCKHHGGNTANGKIHANRIEAIALGEARKVEPYVAVQEALEDHAGAVEWWRQKLVDEPAGEKREAAFREFIVQVDRKAHVAKIAIDAGVEERRVRIAEQLGSEIGDLFAAVFAQLKLTADQQKRAPAIVRAQLELLEGGRQELAA